MRAFSRPTCLLAAAIVVGLVPTAVRAARGAVYRYAANGTVLELTVGPASARGKLPVVATLSVGKDAPGQQVVGGTLVLDMPDPDQGLTSVAFTVKPPIKDGALPNAQTGINEFTWPSVGVINRGQQRRFQVTLLPTQLIGAREARKRKNATHARALSFSGYVFAATANVVFSSGATLGLFASSSTEQQDGYLGAGAPPPLTREQFDLLVPPTRTCPGNADPNHLTFYTYDNLVAAFQKYPFPTTPAVDPLLEWAAYFGQTAHESGNFCYTSEINKSNAYCDPSNVQYPCASGQKYYGRGPIQLSWNYNYGAFSQVWFGDKNVLLQNPDIVSTDGVVGFGASLYFWNVIWTNRWEVTCHKALAAPLEQGGGFGAVTRVINGMECMPNAESDPRQASRVANFKRAAAILGTQSTKLTQNLWCYGL